MVGVRRLIRACGPPPAGALRASVGSQARLGVNFRPLPPEDRAPFSFGRLRVRFAEEWRLRSLQLTDRRIYFCLYTQGVRNVGTQSS